MISGTFSSGIGALYVFCIFVTEAVHASRDSGGCSGMYASE